jgi:DNA-3-methyladenine glycosylase II
MNKVFTTNFYALCNQLAEKDEDLKQVLLEYGYPPLWRRKPTFETLIHFILEQQVSLASALAALNKLKSKEGKITPQKILALDDEELKSCYFSRQKIIYARCLANAVVKREISLSNLSTLADDLVREQFKKIKGIGDWTADVFLMMALHRCDCFPTGDVALMNSVRHIKKLPPQTTKEEILKIAKQWQPYRSVAAYLLWHAYIERKKTVKAQPNANIEKSLIEKMPWN